MEHILSYKGDVYRLDNNLNLSIAREEKIVYTQPLITHKVNIFSADIDASGRIHIAAVLAGTLTYIKYENKKASTTHLMRLPDNFSITSLVINCEASLRLNYCVKSKEGCAIIEYTKKGESWQGKNIYTCQEDMLLKYVKKNKNECYAVKNNRALFNAYEPEKIIFESIQPISEVEGVFQGVVFSAGESIYLNGAEISSGQEIYTLDPKRILIRDKDRLREFSLDNVSRFSGEVNFYRNPHTYIYCLPDHEKRKILSPPYPYIKTEPEMKHNGGLIEEVYMQQRTLFQLQAEIKSLKQRINQLESIVKNR